MNGYILGNPIQSNDKDNKYDTITQYIKAADARIADRIANGYSTKGSTKEQTLDINFDGMTEEQVLEEFNKVGYSTEGDNYTNVDKMLSDIDLNFIVNNDDANKLLRFAAQLETDVPKYIDDYNNSAYYPYSNKYSGILNSAGLIIPEITEEGEYAVAVINAKNKINLTDKDKVKRLLYDNSNGNLENLQSGTDSWDGNKLNIYKFSIDKSIPEVVNITYSTTDATNENVIATITFNEPVKTIGANSYNNVQTITFTENGTINTTFYDEAGNNVVIPVTVNNIDKITPVVTITQSDVKDAKDVTLIIKASDNGKDNDYIKYNNNATDPNIRIRRMVPGEDGKYTFNTEGVGKIVPAANDNYNQVTITKNGSYDIRVKDSAGNVTRTVINIDNIDTTAPTYTVVYSTTDPTNGDVTATVYFNEPVAIAKADGTYDTNPKYITTYTETFTENKTKTINFKDEAGNTGSASLTVENINRTAPPAPTVTKNPTNWTNDSVNLHITCNNSDGKLIENLEYIKVNGAVILAISRGSNREDEKAAAANGVDYTVTENGEYVVEAIDVYGNASKTIVTVDNIDKVLPEIEAYVRGNLEPSQKVEIKMIARDYESKIKAISFNGEELDMDSAEITEDGAKIEIIKEVAENREYVITALDEAGNRKTTILRVENIDKIAPTATVEYSTKDPTNGDVTATVYFNEPVAVANTDGTYDTNTQYITTYTEIFTQNTEESGKVLNFKDEAGNIGSVTLEVKNIDKTEPEVPTVTGNPESWTNKDVVLNITAADNEDGLGIAQIRVNGGAIAYNSTSASYTVKENGIYTIEAVDKAGNINSTEINVTNIDKEAPVVHIDKPDLRPSKNVTLTIDAFDTISGVASVKVNGITANTDNTYLITENGTYTIVVTDNAGNITTVTQTIENIDKSVPNVTIQSAGNRYILSNKGTSKITANLHAYDEDGILNIKYLWSYVKEEDVIINEETGETEKQNVLYYNGKPIIGEDNKVILENIDTNAIKENIKLWNQVKPVTQDELKIDEELKNTGLYVLFIKATDKAGNEYVEYKEYEVIDRAITISYKAGIDGSKTENINDFTDNSITEPITIEMSYDQAVKTKQVSFDNKTYYNPNKLVINKNGTLIVTVEDCNDNTYVETININKINEQRPILTINETSRKNTTITYELQWNKANIDFITNNIIVRNAEKISFTGPTETQAGTKATLVVDYGSHIKNNETKDVEVLVRANDSLDKESYIAYYSSRVDRKAPELERIDVYVKSPVVTVNSDIIKTKKYYNNEETITIEAIFSENIELIDNEYPTLNISFGGQDAKSNFTNKEVKENKIIYTYRITDEDNGEIKLEQFTGTVKDDQENKLNIQRFGNVNVNTIISDTILPYVTEVNLTTTDKKTNLKNGDIITVKVNLSEAVYKRNVNNVEKITTTPIIKFKLGNTTRTLSNGILSEDGKSITYTYTISNDTGTFAFLKENDTTNNTFGSYETNNISDIAGNKFTIANNEEKNYKVTLNGEEVTDIGNIDINSDTTAATIENVTMTYDSGKVATSEYQTGDKINIAVNFSEQIYTAEGELLTDVIYKTLQDDEILYDILDENKDKTIGYIIKHVDEKTANKIEDTISKYIPELVLDIDGRNVGKSDGVKFEDIANVNGKTVVNYSYTIKYEDFGGIEIKSLVANNDANKVYDKAYNETTINYSGTDFKYYENNRSVLGSGNLRINRVKAPFVKYIVKVQDESGNWVVAQGGNYKKNDTIQIVAGFDGHISGHNSTPDSSNNLYVEYEKRNTNLYSLTIKDENGTEIDKIDKLVNGNRNSNVSISIGSQRAANKTIDKNMAITYTYQINKENLDNEIEVAMYNEENGNASTLRNYKNETYTFSKNTQLTLLGITIDTTTPTANVNGKELKDGENSNVFIDETEIIVSDTDISSWTLEKQREVNNNLEWYILRSGNENPILGTIRTPGKYKLTLTDKAKNVTIYYFEIISSNDVKSGIIGEGENSKDYETGNNSPIEFTGFDKYEDSILTKNDVSISLKEANHKLNVTDKENNSIELKNGLIISKLEYIDEDIRLHRYEENYKPNYNTIEFGTSVELTNPDDAKDYTVKATLIDTAGNMHEIYYYITIDQEKPKITTYVTLDDTTLKNNADIYKEGTRLYIRMNRTETIYYNDENAENRNVVYSPKLKVYFGEGENKKLGTANGGYAVSQGSYNYAYTIGKDDNGPISLEFDSLKVYDEAGNYINLLDDSKTEELRVIFNYNNIQADTELPTVDIKLYDDEDEITTGYTNKDEVTVKFNWSEAVTGFEMSDVNISGGILSNFNVISEKEYTAILNTSSIQNGNVRISIEQDSARDIAGNYSIRKEIAIVKDKKAPELQSITAYVKDSNIKVDTSINPYKEYYNAGEQIIIETVFSETLRDENLPTMNLKFGNENAKGSITSNLSENKITYIYTIEEGDNGLLSIGRFAGNVYDLAGNSLRVGNKSLEGDTIIADTTAPKLENINILTKESKTNLKAGDSISIELTYSENIYAMDENTIKKLTQYLISSEIFEINEMTVKGNKVIYVAVINENKNGTLNTVNYNGIVYDIAGNKLEASKLPENTTILINGKDTNSDEKPVIVIDTIAPTIANENGITITAEADIKQTAPYYRAGTMLNIKVKLSENVNIVKGQELNGVSIAPITQSELYFGEALAKGTMQYVQYDETDKTLIFKYVVTAGDNGEFKLVIPENAIQDIAGNLNSKIIIDASEQAVADTEAPTVTLQKSLELTETMNTFTVTAKFSEDLYDVEDNNRIPLTTTKAPKLIYTYNNQRVEVEATGINGNLITYTITINSETEIATSEIKLNGFTGTAYDRAGNGYESDQTSLFIKTITVKPSDSSKINAYNKYKAGSNIRIEVEFNKDITISQTNPSISISFNETNYTLTGNIENNRIIFNHTISDGDNGELKVNGITGVVKDANSNETYALRNISIDGLNSNTIIADTIAPIPTVTVQNVQNAITNADTIIYKVKWDEAVIGFTKEDITVQNGTIIAYSYDETLNEATVEALKLNDGKQVVFITENVCEDQAGNGNSRSNITNITVDTTVPTVRALVNGGNYVIDSKTNKAKISTRLEINEELSSLKYKWSTTNNVDMSNATEMNLSELDINDIPLEKEIADEGTWYLYISATDKAGNTRNVKTKVFDVKASTINITLSNTEKTNQDIVATVEYGSYLTENRLVRVGEQGSADPTRITVKENGVVYAEATDRNGNKVTKEIKVENIFKNPPKVEVTTESTLENSTIKVDITDNGAGIKSTVVTNSKGEVIKPNEDGTYTVTEDEVYKVTVEDNAGNIVEKEIEAKKDILEITTKYDIIEADGKRYIKVSKGTTVSQIIDGIIIKNSAEANIKKEVYDGENKHAEGMLKTGETIRVDNVEKYIIVVNGDVTCDGKVDLDDVFRANTYRMKALTSEIDTLYKLATDADNNNEIDIFDIFRINTIRLSK